MPDSDSYRAAREARADLARRAARSSHRSVEETTTHLVDGAVFRYEHPERGSHYLPPPPAEPPD
ncbi:hypothetical protein [Actinophytocola sp.]|uniref:hypothetical protein n=1 Tax=Actinophytocola sp. TaxID=1872138 RepID=UPI002ED510E6